MPYKGVIVIGKLIASAPTKNREGKLIHKNFYLVGDDTYTTISDKPETVAEQKLKLNFSAPELKSWAELV